MRRLSLASAILLGFAAPASAASLVVNGSFELGFSGWTLSGSTRSNPASIISYNSTASYPNGAYGERVPANTAATASPDLPGTRAAYFVDDYAVNETLSQSVFLTAGTYQMGFSAYLPQNGFNNRGEATFVGRIAGVTLADFAASAAPARLWQTFSGTTQIATDGTYTVQFVFNTNLAPSKDVVIDQVYIIPIESGAAVPEPASLGLFAAGLLGLGALRRRRS
ncbi:PEP-CTERM sorting domain-containing protein [Roseomonas sp. AR75]|jgi:hypothetical protein|uniref:PEP-CTERM sorting domain-containing protein n=1 Tax=Roseomonas sp. AR75 TaxID=2562311 RepID=UPI0019819B70|nr:PEP-CTERM sorting domain-containing protein [Roseomonas sp. AR75]